MSSSFYLPILGTILFCIPSLAFAETNIRLASWNIANFHHHVDVELREGIGTKRQQADFEALKRYAEGLAADVVAPQEVGTQEAVARLFPASEYQTFIESRYVEDTQAAASKDIHAAVVVRKRDDSKVLEQRDILGLQIADVDEDGGTHYTRRGTALKLDVFGTSVWVVSVHLKSSCSTQAAPDQSTDTDCLIFWQQRLPLKEFIDERVAEHTAFIIAGDFNRRFRQFNFQDPMWRFLNGENLDEPLLVAYPETVTRKCPTRLGASTQPIDWIVMDAKVSDWFKEGSYRVTRSKFADVSAAGGQGSERLSDHCPIQIDLVLL